MFYDFGFTDMKSEVKFVLVNHNIGHGSKELLLRFKTIWNALFMVVHKFRSSAKIYATHKLPLYKNLKHKYHKYSALLFLLQEASSSQLRHIRKIEGEIAITNENVK